MKKERLVEYSTVRLRRKMTESAGKGRIWAAPVWKLDVENLNGRTYTRELAKRIVAENAITGVCDGHDNWEGDYGNFKAVARNPWIEDDEMWVEIEIFDEEYAKLLETLMSLGIAIGVSSVGYGTDKDGVIDVETYELVRYLDFVSMPANPAAIAKKKEDKETPDEPAGSGKLSTESIINGFLEIMNAQRGKGEKK